MLLYNISAYSQSAEEILLWPNGAPQSNGITEKSKIVDNHVKTNISEAKLYIYRSDEEKNTRSAVIICPGGGYSREAVFHEGHQYAEWLSKQGITGIVLEYRLPNRHPEIPLTDAQQAIRFIRSKSNELNIDPNKIGISGFSAGGHLAASVGTRFDLGDNASPDPIKQQSCRPDFMILFYPVITMETTFTHLGSRNNLLGENPTDELIDLYSCEKQITKATPPSVLFLSDDDKAVVPDNSIDFYVGLKKSNIPAAMYVFPEGGHGWGMNSSFLYHEEWKDLLLKWLKEIVKN